MSTSVNEPLPDESRVPRLAAFALAVVALVLCLLAIRDARRDGATTIEAVDFGENSYDAIVTAPTSPEAFTETTIWTLDSQRVAVFPDASGVPTARFATPDTSGLFGLDGDIGLVALALVPPNLGEPIAELRISPLSTAVALVGLHPDLTTADDETQLARLIRIAQHPDIGRLAERVDGDVALTEWSPADRDLLGRIVADVGALPVTGAGCPGQELLAGPIRTCGSLLVNSGVTSVLIADLNGAPCALLPPALETVTDEGRAAMRNLLFNGAPIDPDTRLTGEITAQSVDVSASCGTEPQVLVDTDANPEWIPTATAYRVWVDDVAATARLVGGSAPPAVVDPETTMLVRSQEIAGGGIPTAFERLRVSSAHVRTPGTAPRLGLLPVSDRTAARLRNLTELLGELYQ